MKPMHPTKFLGCNSWTLPFPIPAGGQGPAGLQSARSRAGPAGQSSGFWPLDLQRTLGCLGKPRGSDLSAKGWSGQGLEPKGEAFLRPPGCANRGRTTWFPAPRSPSSLTCGPHPSAAPTGCRPLGTQERTQWAFQAATATPERTTGNPSPTPARSAPRPAPPRPCHAPGAFPAAVGIPGAQLGPPPIPATTRFPTRAARLRPAPGALPVRCPPSPRAPGEPRPHARFQESLWDLAPRPVKREDNPSSPQRQSKLSRIQGSNEGYGKERRPDLGGP